MERQLRKQVLVVEDHPLIRIVACDALADQGITACEAGDADEALEVLTQNPLIGLVFTDLDVVDQMHGIDFVRVVQTVRPDVKLIITSGAVTDPVREFENYAAYLLKPYPVNRLVELVAEKLDE